MNKLAIDLFDKGCIKFGEFKLKSGIISPVYVDLRGLISYPVLLDEICSLLADLIDNVDSDFRGIDRIAGIPYAGIPIAVMVSQFLAIPMIYARKEAKEYGIARVIEGNFQSGEKVVVIDDVITDGASKIETIAPLNDAGLIVKDIVVVLDREQGGARILAEKGYKLHSLLTLSGVMKDLVASGRIEQKTANEVKNFIAANQF